MEPQNSKKGTWLIILVVLALVVGGIYYWMTIPQTPEAVFDEVQVGLESVDLGDLDAEIEALDMDLEQL